MSFRRYVGKVVQVTAKDGAGDSVIYLSKLFEYEQSGIWLHHTAEVAISEGDRRVFSGYLFIPHTHLISVFGCDELDEVVENNMEAEANP